MSWMEPLGAFPELPLNELVVTIVKKPSCSTDFESITFKGNLCSKHQSYFLDASNWQFSETRKFFTVLSWYLEWHKDICTSNVEYNWLLFYVIWTLEDDTKGEN